MRKQKEKNLNEELTLIGTNALSNMGEQFR